MLEKIRFSSKASLKKQKTTNTLGHKSLLNAQIERLEQEHESEQQSIEQWINKMKTKVNQERFKRGLPALSRHIDEDSEPS